jgi:hypothetical protein
VGEENGVVGVGDVDEGVGEGCWDGWRGCGVDGLEHVAAEEGVESVRHCGGDEERKEESEGT